MLKITQHPFPLILCAILLLPGCDLEKNINQTLNQNQPETITPSENISETSSLAQNSSLNLQNSGQGIFELENRDTVGISAVSFSMIDSQKSNIVLFLNDDRTIEFTGEAIPENPYTIVTSLTNSGMADAEGYLVMQYQNDTITLLQGDGLLDSQSFSISFGPENNTTTPDNQSSDFIPFYQQQGRGIFSLEGRENENISSVMIQLQDQDSATIGISLSNDTIINFRGRVSHQDAYTIHIEPTSSGMADASGLLKLEYGANNSINNFMGSGKLDGQNFLINFSE
ncbi:hypothetical protein IQ215_02185 [Cyanobacterium stanieri LEGE 03274]|uniref:Uncharacterized protein n=1 Tax=Cyanobacterium stanieri LEGE 03274 TaxID=1828756 RepID=A0ABR9V2Z9_9CHRO|nr:hypothetical protein [Cyanobacterium stanieri]MBE9221496.1 hypothetical protein [Cyanobacterium stanieri LEGE 03274]